jgi:subtilisin family serine protease
VLVRGRLLSLVLIFICWNAISRTAHGTTITIRFEPDVLSFPTLDGGHAFPFVASMEDAVPGRGYGPLLNLLREYGAQTFRPIAPHFRHLTNPIYDRLGNEIELIDMTDDYVVTLAHQTNDVDQICQWLSGLPGIKVAEPVLPGEYFYVPNDEYFDLQWYLANTGQDITAILGPTYPPDTSRHCIAGFDVGASAAWDSLKAPGTKIALIDTGVLSTHDDLLGGIDYRSDSGDDCGHGTALSGTLVSSGNNEIGIAGLVRPNYLLADSSLIVLKNEVDCLPDGGLTSDQLGNLLDSPYYPDFLAINESWDQARTRWDYNSTLRDAHRNAYSAGLTITVASGNAAPWCGDPTPADSCLLFPSSFDNFVLSVSGMNCRGVAQYVQNTSTDLAAPSNLIVTTHKDVGGEQYMGVDTMAASGTSFSAPLTAGVAAMLLGANANLETDDIGHVLRETAIGITGQSHGHGLVQLDDAMDYVSQPNVVYHGQRTTYSSTHVESRYQEFKNVPGANSSSEQWETFWVRVYQVDISAPFSFPRTGETAVDAWPRKRLSTGFPNESKIDRLMLTGYLEVVPGSVSDNGCTLRTYTYKIYADSSSTTCLAWFPFAITGLGNCTAQTRTVRFDYSYIGTVGSGKAVTTSCTKTRIRTLERHHGIDLYAEGFLGRRGQFEIYDVGGRRIWNSGPLESTEGLHARWELQSGGQRAVRGVYFVRFRGDDGRVTNKKLVVLGR